MNDATNLNSQTILLTGGTGSFGAAFIRHLLSNKKYKGIIRIFSRNESKQLAIRQEFNDHPSLRFLIGDVRDMERVLMAVRGTDMIIHAAALRQISALEYNPFEAINTNIIGSQHIIRAAIETNVKRVIFISSSDACHPENLSGVTKLTAEKLFIQSNFYATNDQKFSVVRCGEDLGNFDNLIPNILRQKSSGIIKIDGNNLSRFWSDSNKAAKFVWDIANKIEGGEIFVPKLQSVKIPKLAKALAPKAKLTITGLKQGNKLNEILITHEEIKRTLELSRYFVIQPLSPFPSSPKIKGIPTVKTDEYNSSNNNDWITTNELIQTLK